MKAKSFTSYKEFIKYMVDNLASVSGVKELEGRIYKYHTKSYSCSYPLESESLTPNKFCESLGISNYQAFKHFKLDTLRRLPNYEPSLWKYGYFGGLVGLNSELVNKYVGTGEITNFYDYDINSAYLTALTDYLPTRFKRTLTPFEFAKLSEFDKVENMYFFKIEIPQERVFFFNILGDIRPNMVDFDFLATKPNATMIVSELRLSLINQVYKPNYKILEVYEFEKHKHYMYKNILDRYIALKGSKGKEFKRDALKLYGSLGQIYRRKIKSLIIDGDLIRYRTEEEVNLDSSPQVAMWVADSVAVRLFEIIQSNKDKILSWNTDGFTAIAPIKGIKHTTKPGGWKVRKITGTAHITSEDASRVLYHDIHSNEWIGSNTIEEHKGKLCEYADIGYTSIKRGYVIKRRYVALNLSQQYDPSSTYRALWLKEYYRKEKEYF